MTLTKNIFRENALKSLQLNAKRNKKYKSHLVSNKFLHLLKHTKGKKILFYFPLGLEVNILRVLKQLRKNNEIFIPFMVAQSFKMVPFRLPLHKKKFGIFEAGNTVRNITKIDIAIVPIVGVDGNLQRVGFGKGMYDRFFEKLQKRPYTIFTQLELCYTKELVCDEYDIACDLLITPKKSLKRSFKMKKIGI
jgi:5-formyltetrahydrofolate cyclo-ligase